MPPAALCQHGPDNMDLIPPYNSLRGLTFAALLISRSLVSLIILGKVVSEDSVTSHTCIVMICHSWDPPRSASFIVLTSPLSRSPYQLLMLSRDPISHTFHQGNLIKYQMSSEQGTTCCLFDDSVSHLDHESFQSLLVFRWQVITYPFLDG